MARKPKIQPIRSVDDPRLASKSAKQIAELCVSKFSDYEDEALSNEDAYVLIKQLGAKAVPTLIAHLEDGEDGWVSAMLLAEMGPPIAVPATDALLAIARREHHTSMWACCALGALGKLDELVEIAATDPFSAITGLKYGRPASYPQLAALLDRKDKRLAKEIADALSPGSAHIDRETTVAAFAPFATSPHAVLRRDIATQLSSVPRAERKAAAALLGAMLDDKDAEVRRLAALHVGYCGAAGKPFVPRLEALTKDKKEKVADAAAYAITQLAKKRR